MELSLQGAAMHDYNKGTKKTSFVGRKRRVVSRRVEKCVRELGSGASCNTPQALMCSGCQTNLRRQAKR